ncbi:MAG: hypothetical protein CVU46_04300 [Chloroflexi bacterium HGW-Chloroflexi-8]|nr:MAG: hypothetical protein CVU46_04300 [Chloroflexi bacterium HGW-Chloroflexi-8]
MKTIQNNFGATFLNSEELIELVHSHINIFYTANHYFFIFNNSEFATFSYNFELWFVATYHCL